MPTKTLHRLVVEGPEAALAAFRDDDGLWAHEPWLGMFGVDLARSDAGRLVYRYDDDYKRRAPSVEGMSAAHPALRFTLELCDEFGDLGFRATYAAGRELGNEPVDPFSLEWVGWEYPEE